MFYNIRSISWQLLPSTKVLFMGASHVANGINPKYYIEGMNLGASSERYLFTYLKLKEILRTNNHIEIVFLEFSPTDTWDDADAKYYTEGELNNFINLYAPFFTKEEVDVWSNNVGVFVKRYKFFQKFKIRDRYNYGQYEKIERVYNATNQTYTKWEKAGCQINHKYLDKIVNLCLENDVKIIFLDTPTCNMDKYYDVNAHLQFYNESYSHIEYFDYSNIDWPDSLRADDHHLNHKGAEVFTKMFYNDTKHLTSK